MRCFDTLDTIEIQRLAQEQHDFPQALQARFPQQRLWPTALHEGDAVLPTQTLQNVIQLGSLVRQRTEESSGPAEPEGEITPTTTRPAA